MNYLAHIYLSGDSEEMQVGNFIGDYVKGGNHRDYSSEVEKGILLHRQIDYFTDIHPTVKECAERLKPGYGRYAGVVTDIFFDHFLASKWRDYSIYSLRDFAKRFHAIMLSNYKILPLRVKVFLPFLIQHKRLESYANFQGVETSLEIMARRTSLPSETEFAMYTLEREYDFFADSFRSFFAELIEFAEEEGKLEIKKPRDWQGLIS